MNFKKLVEQMHYWRCFLAFDSHELPENIKEITVYRNYELKTLIDHYGKIKQGTFKGFTVTRNPAIDSEKTRVEWQEF